MTFSVAVAGASGYAGGELLRVLSAHPDVLVDTVTAHTHAGEPLSVQHPNLRSLTHLTLRETTPEVLRGHDVVFLALPHGQSGQYTDGLADVPLVIDAGADHRLTSADDWAQFYSGDFHQPWSYGIPELPLGAVKQHQNLVNASRIAAPGCNASAVILAMAPGVAAGVIDSRDLVSVLAVGTSGAGKSLTPRLLGSEVLGSAAPYAVAGTHRHIPEIVQQLTRVADASEQTDVEVRLSFTPILVPMSRGVLATCTAPIADSVSDADIRQAWEQAYAEEAFVQLLPEGEFPRTADVLGANTALIGLGVDRSAGRVVAVAALDNLTKGTAGAAVQCMNIALKIPEERGLSVNGVAP